MMGDASLTRSRMATLARWLSQLVLLIGVAVVSSCTTLFGVWSVTSTTRVAALTKDLPNETVAMRAAFDARVKARFPIQSSVAAMGAELQREQFIRKDWSDLPDQEHYAERDDGGAFGCNLFALIYWKSDKDEQITAIRGDYLVNCL